MKLVFLILGGIVILIMIYAIIEEIIRLINIKKAKEIGRKWNQIDLDVKHKQSVINQLQNAKTEYQKLKVMERELKRLKEIERRIKHDVH